jgi:hypothetical protein
MQDNTESARVCAASGAEAARRPWPTDGRDGLQVRFSVRSEHLMEHRAVIRFFNEVVALAQQRDLRSGEHFSVK